MAAVWKAPVVFVCENNQYMEYTPIGDVTAVEHPGRGPGSAYGLEPILVDGNDVDAVYAVARDGHRPRARRRRPVAHRGAHVPARRPLAGRSRQVPARRRGRGLEGPRPDPDVSGAADRGRRGGRRASTPSRRRPARPWRPPRPRRAPHPNPARTSSRPSSGPTEARRGGIDVPRRDRRGHRPGDGPRPDVVLIGEDVGAAGGVFKLTEGLFDRFGPSASGTRRSASRRSSARPWAPR